MKTKKTWKKYKGTWQKISLSKSPNTLKQPKTLTKLHKKLTTSSLSDESPYN
jgi:hypothetical protein